MRPCLAVGLIVPLLLTGCALGPVHTDAPTAATGFAIQGHVHGGNQPVSGAHVYLFAANTTGYGGNGIAPSTSNASTSLLQNVSGTTLDTSGGATNGDYYVTSTSTGSFSVSGDYTCPSGAQVYLYALGGNPGSGTNAAAGFLAVLGACPTAGVGGTFNASTNVWMNEVTTVAAANAFGAFASDATHVSSSGTTLAKQGVANAFANAANLATLSTGTALATTPSGAGYPVQAKTNTLANILAACVNSNGAVTGPTNPTSCYTLFNNAQSAGTSGTMPTDTATAAINIAHNPYTIMSAIFPLQAAAGAPFLPNESSADTNSFVSIYYSGNNISAPNHIAIDGAGDAWIVNAGNNSVTEISPSGTLLSGTSGFTGAGLNQPTHIAIDNNGGNAWIVNLGDSAISVFSSAGVALTTNGITGGGLSQPKGIAIDGTGNIWAANYGNNSLTKISALGAVLSSSTGITGGGLNQPNRIAADGAGQIWVTNYGNSSLSEFSSAGAALSSSTGITGGGLSSPKAISIDGSGYVWVANYGAGSISKFTNAGSPVNSTGYTGAGLDQPTGMGFDGAGNLWVINYYDNQVSELTNSGTPISPSTIYTQDLTDLPAGGAIDGSGNVWGVLQGSNMVVELIGAAAPVITPLCAALSSTATSGGTSNLGTRP